VEFTFEVEKLRKSWALYVIKGGARNLVDAGSRVTVAAAASAYIRENLQ